MGPVVVTPTKPGYKTTEFYATVITSVTTWLAHAAQSGQLPLDLTIKLQAGLAAAYSIARGIAKLAGAVAQPSG